MGTAAFIVFVVLQITLVVRSILEEDSGLLVAAAVGLTVAAVVVGLFI